MPRIDVVLYFTCDWRILCAKFNTAIVPCVGWDFVPLSNLKVA
jgi:hypothetical protein